MLSIGARHVILGMGVGQAVAVNRFLAGFAEESPGSAGQDAR